MDLVRQEAGPKFQGPTHDLKKTMVFTVINRLCNLRDGCVESGSVLLG